MIEIRELTETELLEDNIINKEDFPEIICLDSEDFSYNQSKYIDNCKWYGLFDNDKLMCANCMSLPLKNKVTLELIETQINNRDKGYGKQLMDWLINKYKEYDISLTAMYKDLDKFYKKWGFKEIKREPVLDMIRYRN